MRLLLVATVLGLGSSAPLVTAPGTYAVLVGVGAGLLEPGEVLALPDMVGYVPLPSFQAVTEFTVQLRLVAWTPGDAATLRARNVDQSWVEAATSGLPPSATITYLDYTTAPEHIWVEGTRVAHRVAFELDLLT